MAGPFVAGGRGFRFRLVHALGESACCSIVAHVRGNTRPENLSWCYSVVLASAASAAVSQPSGITASASVWHCEQYMTD